MSGAVDGSLSRWRAHAGSQLEDGLSIFGFSREDVEEGRL